MKNGGITIRLDERTRRCLENLANHQKCSLGEAAREAIRQADEGNPTSIIAERLDEIKQRLSEQKTIVRGIDTLSAQLADMTTINSTNTDRIVTVLKSLTERK